jgi:hypothetical protein
MKLIISTEYPDLVRFIFSGMRYETTFPFRDNFLLVKELNHREFGMLERHSNYVVISKSYATEEWGREEIFEYCKSVLKKNRKPIFKIMTDDEYIRNVKIFWTTGVWPTEDVEAGLFSLFKNIDCKVNRWKEYFRLRELGMAPMSVLYALLTFVNKAAAADGDMSGISKGYASVLLTKRTKLKEAFPIAMGNFVGFPSCVDEEFKVVRFLLDIGGGYK